MIPFVLAQTGTNWRTPTRLSDLFPSTLGQDADLRSQDLDFAYHLIDLSSLPYSKLHYRPEARLTLHLLTWARDAEAPVAVALETGIWRLGVRKAAQPALTRRPAKTSTLLQHNTYQSS